MGEVMLIQAMSFAQYERHTIVDRIKKGARARAERGLANGFVPLGFQMVEHRPNHRQINESERVYVEMIFRKFLELKRLAKVVEFLNKEGYKTKEFITKSGKKAGGHKWTISSIHNILTNRAYIGEREINKKNRTDVSGDLSEEDKYFFVDAHWPALIPKELFHDAQRLLVANKKKARKYTHTYRLTGLIQCGQCGQPMVGKSGTGRNGKHFYYGHKRKLTTRNENHLVRCKVENILALALEDAVIGRLKDYAADKELVSELAKSASVSSGATREHQKSLIAVKEQDCRRLSQKYDNLLDTISETSDKVIRNSLSSKLTEISSQLETVQSSLESLKREFAETSNVVNAEAAFKFYRMFRAEFEKQDVSVQSEILKDYVKRLVVREDGVTAEVFGGSRATVVCEADGTIRKNEKTAGSLRQRSAVRTVSKLVAGAGFEPTTFGL